MNDVYLTVFGDDSLIISYLLISRKLCVKFIKAILRRKTEKIVTNNVKRTDNSDKNKMPKYQDVD